jgi:hypothetical protein
MRLYVSPSSTHAGNARVVGGTAPVPTNVDLLDPLDRWVSQGQAPGDALVQVAKAGVPPFGVVGERVLCRWPGWPQEEKQDRSQTVRSCRTAQP